MDNDMFDLSDEELKDWDITIFDGLEDEEWQVVELDD